MRRQYELAVLAANQGGEKQTERVRSLYQRQVQIPLSGNQDVLTEYQAWEASQPGTKVRNNALQGTMARCS